MRLIDADDFRHRMYHEVFEKDSKDQRWDSGCWMRYRLFDRVLEEQPTVTQPYKSIVEDCLYRIYRNTSVYTATEGRVAIKHYMGELWREIFGEEDVPEWMT